MYTILIKHLTYQDICARVPTHSLCRLVMRPRPLDDGSNNPFNRFNYVASCGRVNLNCERYGFDPPGLREGLDCMESEQHRRPWRSGGGTFVSVGGIKSQNGNGIRPTRRALFGHWKAFRIRRRSPSPNLRFKKLLKSTT